MDSDYTFKLDMSLEGLSGTAIAIALWERQDVREKIRKGFSGGKNFSDRTNDLNGKNNQKISSGQKVLDYVLDQLESMHIPKPLLGKIKILVVRIGQKIYYWKKYVHYVLKLNKGKYVNKIYWTLSGQIDELKILEESWLTDKNFPTMEQYKCFVGTDNSLYCLAAMYGVENFVKDHLDDMKKQIFPYLNLAHKKHEWTPYGLIATWVGFCSNQKKTPALREFKNFRKQPDELPAIDLLWKCISKGNIFGAKYFWKMIEGNDKVNIVTEAAEKSLNFMFYYKRFPQVAKNLNFEIGLTFTNEITIRLALFFINQMTEFQKIDFISREFYNIFKLCLKAWPYQDLCENLLNQLWDHISFTTKQIVLELIFKNLASKSARAAVDYNTEKKFYEIIFRNLMEKSSRDLKVAFLSSRNYVVLCGLYEDNDTDVLEIIMNDVDLKDLRIEILDKGNKYFKDLLIKKDYKSLNQFIKNMKLSDDEIKYFKRNKCNRLHKFLIYGDLTAAEKHLNWLGDTDDERNGFKNEVDAVEIFFFLVQNYKFAISDKFLRWRFDAEEERKNMKELLKSENFLLNKIFEIWGGKNDKANVFEKKYSELLNWYFNSSEEKIEEFKRTKLLQNRLLIVKYWDFLRDEKSFKNFDSFLKLCSVTSDEIEVMKINIANNVNWWIDTYGLEEAGYFEMVQALLVWVYENDETEKQRAIRNYMNSSHGSLLVLKVCKYYKKKSHVAEFFNCWITPSLNFKQLKMYLNQVDKAIVSQQTICNIKSLLKTRKANKVVRSVVL